MAKREDRTAGTRMTALVTGGTGFVLSNTVRHLLDTNPDAKVVILDIAPIEGLVEEFFASVGERVTGIQGDILNRALLDAISSDHQITHIVHGAMIAHTPIRERESPRAYVDVNIWGTVNLLEWARSLEMFQRFMYISSGAVYGDPTPAYPTGLQTETGPFNPIELYGITKHASEQIVKRYGELFGFDVLSVRFGPVFGPMERPTRSRATMSMPYHMLRALIEERPLRIKSSTLDGGRDHLSAEDVAGAVIQLLVKAQHKYPVYNVAMGAFITGREMIETLCEVNPAFKVEIVSDASQADVVMDPANHYGRWNGYAIDRVCAEIDWQPRTLLEQLDSYHSWVMADPHRRCPALT